MNVPTAVRRFVASLAAFGLLLILIPAAAAAPSSSALQDTGGVRGANGQTLRVTVKLMGIHLSDLAAKVTITDAGGKVIASGTTNKAGTYSTALDAGTYTVTATTDAFTGTDSVTIESSTSPALLTINLEQKSQPPAAADPQ